MKKKAVFPGSFDPYTIAHHDLVLLAAEIFDVEILICANPFKGGGMFNVKERREIIESVLKMTGVENITVNICDGLVADYCKKNNIPFIVRGIRYNNAAEELDLSRIYYEDGFIETIFFPSYEPKYQTVSSTRVREYIVNGNEMWKYFVPYDAAATITRLLEEKSE